MGELLKCFFIISFLSACNNQSPKKDFKSKDSIKPINTVSNSIDTLKIDSFKKIFNLESRENHPEYLTKKMVEFLRDSSYNDSTIRAALDWLGPINEKEEIERKKKFNDSMILEQKKNDAFLKKNLVLDSNLYEEQRDNFYALHILVKQYTKNEGSLKKAVALEIAKIYSNFYSSETTKKCLIFLYKNKYDFQVDGYQPWFIRGAKTTGLGIEVQPENDTVTMYNY